MDDDLPYIVGLSCLLEIGPVKFNQLISAFGTAREAWRAPDSTFRKFDWGADTLTKILEQRKRIEPLKEFEKCQKKGVTLLTIDDPNYPKLLKEIHDPPFLLYVRGELKPEDEISLTVVGSRRMSPYGGQVIENLIPDLCAAGLTIVSGLAFGVDYKATKTALENGGRTISVLASGVDEPTPVSNASLAEKVVKENMGALVSEFPLSTQAQPFYFPRRDRLLSGLSLGTLVIEAAENSGSLITPKMALEQGREVFAVPGSIFSLVSFGTNNLVKQGAKLVITAADVLQELGIEARNQSFCARQILPENKDEELILEMLSKNEARHVDEIIRESNLGSGPVSAVLTLMELKGMVKNIGNGYYRKGS